MIDTGLHGKVALVTGGNSGIGAEIAKSLAAQGARVAVHYLAEHPSETSFQVEHTVAGKAGADQVVREIEGQAIAVAGDLADVNTSMALLDAAEAALGPVNILVNNAAHCELPDTILETTPGSIDRHFQVNTRAAVLLIKTFAERYQAQGLVYGRIINISTDAAQAFPTQVSYGASKAALEAYTRSLAYELGPLGITINTIAPGPIQTGWMDDALIKQVAPSIPLRRVGYPDDIADATVFLASQQARWITGQVIKVSGGHAL